MAYATVEDRVEWLEAMFGQFMAGMALLNKQAKDRDQAAEARNRLAEARHQAAEERNRLAEARLARFQDEMRQSKRELDKKWGELANKMGTIVEDILAPNLRRLAREHFQFGRIEDFMIRRCRRSALRPDVEDEFDTLVVGPEAVILGEAKSTPRIEHVEAFAGKVGAFFEFFPEYRGKRLIAVLGSWAVPDRVVEQLTARRIYAMRMGEDTMELANATALEAERVG